MIRTIRSIFERLVRYDFRKYNIRLVFFVTILCGIGMMTINSAADGYARKQLLGFAVGVFAMAIISLMDYNFIAKFQWILYAISIIVLISVKLFGREVNGATRWFSLGSFGTLQPSEFVKIMALIIFAKVINDHRAQISSFRTLVVTGLLYIIPLGLILIEPDLSTTLVFIFLFAVLMFVGGLSYKVIGALLAVIIPVGALFIWYVLQPGQVLLNSYQQERLMTFINPSDYLLTTYAQQYNSIMAIGSGLLTGKGLNNNTITSVKGGNFISEPQTDFIFAVLGEELGFVGCLAVIILLLAVVLECLRIASRAKDLTGKLIAAGYASIVTFQVFVNIGVATAILPNTGLPLPFISYGLSSLMANLAGIGLVLNVGLQTNRR